MNEKTVGSNTDQSATAPHRGASSRTNLIIPPLFHILDSEMHRAVAALMAEPDSEPKVQLPKAQIAIVALIVIAGIIVSYWGPGQKDSTFWIGGLSLNVVVAGGLLAFAPWLPERIPDIMTAMLSEAIAVGWVTWQDGLTEATARDRYDARSANKRVWMSLGMTANGLLMLILNLAAFVVMIWLPAPTRVGVTMALLGLMIDVLVNLAATLYGLRLWPIFWNLYKVFEPMHKDIDGCPICKSNRNPNASQSTG